MKVFFTAVWALLYASAEALIEIEPLEALVEIGNVSEQYEPMTADDERATGRAIAALEYMRRFMRTGIDQVPPMDPYRQRSIKPLVFDKPNSKLNGIVSLSNLVATGANHYTINDLEVRLDTKRIDFDIGVPRVVAEVDFSTLNFVYDNILKFNASGHLQITLTNLREFGAISAMKKITPSRKIFVVDAMNMEKYSTNVKVNVNNMEGTLPEDILNEIIQSAALAIAETSMKQMNNILNSTNAEQILAFLLG